MRMARCSSPRPDRIHSPATSVSSTRRATFCSSSRIRRSRIWRLVTYLPSRPAKGLVLTEKVMRTVGCSTSIGGRGRGSSMSVMVSPMPTASMPETAMMLPAWTTSRASRLRLRKVKTSLTRALTVLPAAFTWATAMPGRSEPLLRRPMAILPT